MASWSVCPLSGLSPTVSDFIFLAVRTLTCWARGHLEPSLVIRTLCSYHRTQSKFIFPSFGFPMVCPSLSNWIAWISVRWPWCGWSLPGFCLFCFSKDSFTKFDWVNLPTLITSVWSSHSKSDHFYCWLWSDDLCTQDDFMISPSSPFFLEFSVWVLLWSTLWSEWATNRPNDLLWHICMSACVRMKKVKIFVIQVHEKMNVVTYASCFDLLTGISCSRPSDAHTRHMVLPLFLITGSTILGQFGPSV